nr:CehA/McbA family metallohydrolase [Clostridium sp. BSD2780061688b_171218_E8]
MVGCYTDCTRKKDKVGDREVKDFHPFSGEGQFYRGALHTHTLRSDGALSVEETIAAYVAAGYDFMAITDHQRYWRKSSPDITILNGMEMNGTIRHGEAKVWHHLLCIGAGEEPYRHEQEFPMGDFDDIALAQAQVDAFTDGGKNLIAIAYPEWTQMALDDYEALEGFWAIEVFNNGIFLDKEIGYTLGPWDTLLKSGKRVYGIASDDAHQSDQFDGGWMMVWAADNSPRALTDALREGRFYATTGPSIESFYVKDGVLVVRSSPCRRIVCYTGDAEIPPIATYNVSGAPVYEASYPIKESYRYMRVQCVDEDYQMAFSQPIWLEDLAD